MTETTRLTLQDISDRLTRIENLFSQLVDLLGNHLSVRSIEEEVKELKTEVACLTDERTIFNKK